jgi:hypothetical protein
MSWSWNSRISEADEAGGHRGQYRMTRQLRDLPNLE